MVIDHESAASEAPEGPEGPDAPEAPQVEFNIPPTNVSGPWIVVQTKPNREKALTRFLAGVDIPFFLPLTERQRDSRNVSLVPLFIGTVFAAAHPEQPSHQGLERSVSLMNDSRHVFRYLRASGHLQDQLQSELVLLASVRPDQRQSNGSAAHGYNQSRGLHRSLALGTRVRIRPPHPCRDMVGFISPDPKAIENGTTSRKTHPPLASVLFTVELVLLGRFLTVELPAYLVEPC